METAKLTTVTCQVIGRPKPSHYNVGDYRPVKFVAADGTEFWKAYDVGCDELTWLKRGEQYPAVIADDGQTYTVCEPTDKSPQKQAADLGIDLHPAVKPAPVRDEVGRYIDDMAGLYAQCYRAAAAQLDGASEAAIQAAASAVFAATCAKFDR